MNKILNIIAVLFILTPKAVLGANFNEEEKFVETFADEAISILSNDQVSKNEKNDQFTSLVMSSIDLNLISQ